jgi:signal transduction histidine kinase
MGQKSLDLATADHYEQGQALAWLTMGVAYGTKAMYPEALDCHLKALRLTEKLGLTGLMENDYMVIRNLVDNAIKFSREGDTISLSVGSTPDGVLVTISDTGLGIPLEDQHRIFTSISYTTTGTSREKGSGLGLSLCKEMIDKNGGKIWFDSKPGKGTSFTFTLPGQAAG